MCAGYDIADVERQFELILKLNSWQEVFAAMRAGEQAEPEGSTEPAQSTRKSPRRHRIGNAQP